MVEVPGYKRLTVFSMILLFLGMSASMGFSPEDTSSLSEEKPSFETSTTSTPYWPGSQSGSIYTYDSVDIGMNHVCAVATDNTVRCWGANDDYQIGNQSTSFDVDAAVPVVVDYNGGHSQGTDLAVSIGAGGYHNCAIETDGTLKCWGANYYGQTGTMSSSNTLQFPGPVVSLDNSNQLEVLAIDAGLSHTCAIVGNVSSSGGITNDGGRVACWGRNHFGQIGDDTTIDRDQPVYVVDENGNEIQNVTAISVGRIHNCAIVDGNAMCWGYNVYGNLGNESLVGVNNYSPHAVNVTTLQHTQRQAVAVGSGFYHSCALLDNGSVSCWGNGDDYEFGDGSSGLEYYNARYVSFPQNRTAITLEVGDNHNCAILDDNSTWCWGEHNRGQRGDGGIGGSYPTQVQTSGYYFTSISAGQYNTCGISNTQQVYCWGENWNYQVGIGTGSSSDVTTPALVNLGPSTQNGPQQYPLIHDRDPDNDGILSIFDDTPLAPDCLAGTYFILGIGCVDTDPGYYQDTPHNDFQIPCPIGTFQPNSGSATCIDAPPGYYVDTNASVSATPCPPGSQQPLSAQTECLGIDSGHYSPPGTPSQIPCIPGTFQPQPNQSSCLPSDPGYHVPIEGQAHQTICPPGTYQPGYGLASCYEASPGNHVSQEGSIGEEECQVGTYADVFGLSECKLASPGHYVNSIAATSQEPCSAGEYQPDSGQTSCLLVDAGHYSNAGSGSMVPCEVGYYQGAQGSGSCIAAEPGYFVQSEGSTTQEMCTPGTYSENAASSLCTEASPGYYSESEGSTTQEICLPGSYSSAGAASCELADPGYIVSYEGASQQEACTPGSYQPATGSTDCIAASPGNFVSTNAAIAQTECMPGTYQWESGQTGCVDSPAGKYSAQAGASTVENCNPGTYQPYTGQSSCLEADMGHFVDEYGATEQVQCEVGSFQSQTGQSSCQLSNPGHKVSSAGSFAETQCSPGTYQPLFGKDSCILASAGHFVESAGSFQQTACPSGESQPEEGQSSCIVDDDGGLPIIAIAGAAIAVLAIGGILMVQGNSKPAPKGKRVRRPPEDVRRQKKRPKGEQKKKPKEASKKKNKEE